MNKKTAKAPKATKGKKRILLDPGMNGLRRHNKADVLAHTANVLAKREAVLTHKQAVPAKKKAALAHKADVFAKRDPIFTNKADAGSLRAKAELLANAPHLLFRPAFVVYYTH
ncbi:hypothetical protein AGMMS4952_17590 [Spirochaetia bacterium]|nr:hypothetical protein AGMMS4952_17590 [Spirochaetia bacterium]